MRSKIDWSLIDRKPKTDEEYLECLASKLWRMNNIYHVNNKLGNLVPFRMNALQRKVAEVRHNRKIILKSRQVGISTYHLLYNLDEAIFNENQVNGVMAQGLDEAAELLEKCRVAWDNLNPKIKEFLDIKLVTDNSKEYAFSNGSKLMIRTSFRSGTLQNLHISELGKIAAKFPDKAKELKTGTLQAIGGKRKVTVESTAEGKSGLFYELWKKAEDHIGAYSELDFVPIFISWIEDPDCTLNTPQSISPKFVQYFEELETKLNVKLKAQQKWFYVAKYRELGDDITQEYPSTPEEAFSAARDGTYYANQMKTLRKKNRIVENLYDKNLKVHVAMDLGMNDDFTMVFFQYFQGETRVIDEYSNNGEPIIHYVNILKSKPYKYGHIYGPHDLKVKELGTGKSRREIFRSLGVNVRVVKNIPILDGIEHVRAMLANTWIDKSCAEVLGALDNYSKEWDEKRATWKDKPLHNQWSHMADAIRYMALTDIVDTVHAYTEKKSIFCVVPPVNGLDI